MEDAEVITILIKILKHMADNKQGGDEYIKEIRLNEYIHEIKPIFGKYVQDNIEHFVEPDQYTEIVNMVTNNPKWDLGNIYDIIYKEFHENEKKEFFFFGEQIKTKIKHWKLDEIFDSNRLIRFDNDFSIWKGKETLRTSPQNFNSQQVDTIDTNVSKGYDSSRKQRFDTYTKSQKLGYKYVKIIDIYNSNDEDVTKKQNIINIIKASPKPKTPNQLSPGFLTKWEGGGIGVSYMKTKKQYIS